MFIVFVKNDRIAISADYFEHKSIYHLKKCRMDNDIHISIKCIFNFPINFYTNQKKGRETE